ncbi:hypothetical protein TNCV_3108701 [Trichonephila clavipes]|uniref:Uncharacterized protein n=1 Tax=Trichonephila clavipes TaxID=2585209 RepID=A0A8X6S486_TRICX|nr:hypothetical protein TNCV_3108701 [Trichonephila clavipes]
MKKGSKRNKKIHLLDVEHVYNLNHASQLDVRNAATGYCHRNCSKFTTVGPSTANTARRMLSNKSDVLAMAAEATTTLVNTNYQSHVPGGYNYSYTIQRPLEAVLLIGF